MSILPLPYVSLEIGTSRPRKFAPKSCILASTPRFPRATLLMLTLTEAASVGPFAPPDPAASDEPASPTAGHSQTAGVSPLPLESSRAAMQFASSHAPSRARLMPQVEPARAPLPAPPRGYSPH